jgi:hypothetical protein
MSGEKFVNVESRELTSLRNDSSKLRALRQDLPERIEAAVRRNQAELNRRLEPIEARQRKFSKEIGHLRTDIRNVEQRMASNIENHARQTRQALHETNTRMEKQRRELRTELVETAHRLEQANKESEQRLRAEIHATEDRLLRLNDETREQMHEQEKRLKTAIEQERVERQEQVKNLQGQINAIHQDRERLSSEAGSWVEAAQTIHDFIESNYRHEHFKPGSLKDLENTITIARSNITNNAEQAALSKAQEAYQALSNLRVELEGLETEWLVWQEQVLTNARRLLAEAQANRRVPTVEETGELSEVNYWTGGKLTALEQDIEATIHRAEDDKKPLTIKDMKRLAENSLPEYDQRLDEIVVEAQMAIVSSQIRVNVADLAMQALEEQGFSVQDGTYEGEDMRNGFMAKAINREGSEVVVSVIPEENGNRMEVNSFEPHSRAPGELLKRSQEIARSMKGKGLNVSDVQTISETPNNNNRDFDKVRKRKKSQI